MNGFFAILVTLFIAEVVSARGKEVKVKIGEKVALLDEKSGFIYSRVAVYEASKDDKQMMKEIFNYCTPKEKESGCTNKNCSTFLLDYETVSLTPLHAGCFTVKIFTDRVNKLTLIVEANDQLLSTVSPDPQWESAKSYSTKGPKPPETDDIGGVIGGVITGVIGGVITWVIIGFIKRRHKKNELKKSGGDTDSEENVSQREIISEAGEESTGDSFEMDGIPPSADEDRLDEVLIDNASVGQERKRSYYSDNEDDHFNSTNNKNEYDDSNYYSNDDNQINDFNDTISNNDDKSID